MGQSFKNAPNKICGRQPLKNFTWSILEYFVPYTHIVTLHRKRLADLIIWKMHGFSYKFPIAWENATKPIVGQETGTLVLMLFPKYGCYFSHPIPI